jgi:hypothetical protein
MDCAKAGATANVRAKASDANWTARNLEMLIETTSMRRKPTRPSVP